MRTIEYSPKVVHLKRLLAQLRACQIQELRGNLFARGKGLLVSTLRHSERTSRLVGPGSPKLNSVELRIP